MFLNRTHELGALEQWWEARRPELVSVYGRRHVGKTELLVRFLQGKPAIYYYADRQPLPDQLRAFTDQVALLTDDPLLRVQVFASWEAAIGYVLRLGIERRIALVIDEFSYAVDADPSLPSVIQRLWDGARRDGTQAFIVLCTSFTEAVERHFLVDGALYRRRTRQLVVDPFWYRDAALFFPQWSPLDRLIAWGVVGGVPSYLQALGGESLEGGVISNLLDKTSILYSEAEMLLAQEVRGIGPALLRGMLAAIAYGCSEPNQIAQRVGRPMTSLSGALRFLTDYGLIQRRIPFTVPNPERSRSTRYYIADNYLTFWFRFVLPNRSLLEQNQAAEAWRSRIAPALSTYMGSRFAVACRQFVLHRPDQWKPLVAELGVWWRASDELDIVGLDEARTVVLAAEAKWTDDLVGLDVLHTLQRRVAQLPKVAPDHQLVLFAKTGFTEQVLARQSPALRLITAIDMLQ